jgi:Xaa-Pro aminopeptidase
MLDPQFCRRRQERLLKEMTAQRLDAVALGTAHHVYYFSSHLPDWKQQGGFALGSDGRSWLTTANALPKITPAADEVVPYEANWFGTLRLEQPQAVAQLMRERLRAMRARRIGLDSSAVTSQLALHGDDVELVSIDESLFQMRRAKDPDELELMKKAIRCTEMMYARARQIIEPDILETRVFSELHAAAVEEAGGPLSAPMGNDFACGVGGGPPRAARHAQPGEIYILDLGPAYRGYFADNCRAIAVDRKPTDLQLKAWHDVVSCFEIVEQMARPGARCRDIFEAVDRRLHLVRGGGMPHHLGHGVGLAPHEFPHLNPKWDDTLIEGEIFTAEPGQYAHDLRGGIRLENQYLVTNSGVQNLTPFPMELT